MFLHIQMESFILKSTSNNFPTGYSVVATRAVIQVLVSGAPATYTYGYLHTYSVTGPMSEGNECVKKRLLEDIGLQLARSSQVTVKVVEVRAFGGKFRPLILRFSR